MGRGFWCFFWELATLKAYVDSASLRCLAVLRLRNHPATKHTIFPQHHQPASSSQNSAPSPPRVPALNVSRITESPSHIKSQTSTVTSHIYLEKLLWHDRVLRGLANQACFLSMCCVKRRQKLRLLTPDFNIRLAFWSLTHQKWLTVKWCNFSSLNQGAFKFLAV